MADEDTLRDEQMIEDAKNAVHDRGGPARKEAHKRRVLEHMEKQEQGLSPQEALEARIKAKAKNKHENGNEMA